MNIKSNPQVHEKYFVVDNEVGSKHSFTKTNKTIDARKRQATFLFKGILNCNLTLIILN